MRLVNVSSRSRVAGSDYDLNLWLPSMPWKIATFLLSALGVGCFKRPKTYRLAVLWPVDVELFLVDEDDPDQVTLASEANAQAQKAWDVRVFAAYEAAKQAEVALLHGRERKAAKAQLAVRFGLNPVVYGMAQA